jgi:hypothetical protein
VRSGTPRAAESGRERVPKILKADRAHPGLDAGGLEPARDFRAVQFGAELGMGEDEVLVVAEDGA